MKIGSNTWEIVEHFDEPTSSSMLHALERGTNALSFSIDQAISDDEKQSLFHKIDTSIIRLYLDGELSGVQSIIDSKINAVLPYSMQNIVEERNGKVEYLIDTIHNVDFDEETLSLLQKLKKARQGEYVVKFKLTNQYLDNIVKLRVIELLWKHLESSLKVKNKNLRILAETGAYPFHTAIEEDLVYASIQLMSATIGSADSILLRNSEKSGHSDSFKSRITRNLHHLASYEAKMDLVSDPLKGSYYIENQTLSMAEKIWNKFIA